MAVLLYQFLSLGKKSAQTQQFTAVSLSSQFLWVRSSEMASVSALHRAPHSCVSMSTEPCSLLDQGKTHFHIHCSCEWNLVSCDCRIRPQYHAPFCQQEATPRFQRLTPYSIISETKLFLCFIFTSLPQGLELP